MAIAGHTPPTITTAIARRRPPRRRGPTGQQLTTLRRFFCAALLAAGLGSAAGRAIAQPAKAPAVVGGKVAAPIEIAMSVVNGDVRCAPPRARLPARDPLELAVINRAERPLWFVAPAFFRTADHIESRGFTLDLVQGGFLVAPRSTATVLLRSPRPGEYYYSCYEPGHVPRPESSGFLIVVPAAR